MDGITHNALKEISFNSNSQLRDKVLAPAHSNYDKENEDIFNKLWSCHKPQSDNHDENEFSNQMAKFDQNYDLGMYNKMSASAQKPYFPNTSF